MFKHTCIPVPVFNTNFSALSCFSILGFVNQLMFPKLVADYTIMVYSALPNFDTTPAHVHNNKPL